jgi:hypothetical protein
MTKAQKKEHILANLSLNHCIISDAIDEVCSREEYDQFYDSDKDFKESVNQLKSKRNDFVKTVQMDLIASGDSKQVLEYLKDIKETEGDILGGIQRETMLYIIETAQNNTTAIEIFMKIFNCTKYRANQIFSEQIAQNDLESPTARNKRKEDTVEKSLFKRFERGELDKIEMYKELVKDALYMSEFAAREDVRLNAGKLVITYDEHLVKEEERIRRESESDESNLIDKCDALFFGASVASCERVRHDLITDNIKAIEDASDSK